MSTHISCQRTRLFTPFLGFSLVTFKGSTLSDSPNNHIENLTSIYIDERSRETFFSLFFIYFLPFFIFGDEKLIHNTRFLWGISFFFFVNFFLLLWFKSLDLFSHFLGTFFLKWIFKLYFHVEIIFLVTLFSFFIFNKCNIKFRKVFFSYIRENDFFV